MGRDINGNIMDRISVAIITFNEEKNIEECLRSVDAFADEVIVLDSFSTDKTLEICARFPKVKASQNPFYGHIEQKNKAISLCTGSWILCLDADERCSPELSKSISDLKGKTTTVDGFLIPRLTYHMGKFIRHSGWYPLRKIRLLRKGAGEWTGENPHDYIHVRGNKTKLNGDIIHYSFTDLSHQIDTINKFSSIVSFTRFNKKQRFSLIKTIFKPVGKFIEIYIAKRGFLDGFPGFTIAIASAFSTFLKYAKIYEMEKNIIQRPSNIRKEYGDK